MQRRLQSSEVLDCAEDLIDAGSARQAGFVDEFVGEFKVFLWTTPRSDVELYVIFY